MQITSRQSQMPNSEGAELIENRLVIHHVGGRGGIRGFPVLPAFERDFINVMYDADENCVPEMLEYSKSQPSKTMVLPYCISAGDGDCIFHLNYDPFTSSIYPFNPRYAQFYSPYPAVNSWPRNDYVVGDTLCTMEEVSLSTTSLDAVVLDRGEAPSPDLLSLDTQGSELDILNGASRLLDTTVLAVQTEVELHPFYLGQPLFGDICEFLARYGFDFVELQPFPNWLPIRGKHGFRGEGYTAAGEAWFLKRPETVRDSAGGVQLNKLAYIATILGQFECAQQCFETPGFKYKPQSESNPTDPQPRYLDFISRLAGAVASLPPRSVPLFSDVYSYTQSQTRFPVVAPQPRSQSLLRRYVKAIPPLVSAIRFFRTLPQRLKRLSRSVMIRVRWRLNFPDSPVEALFLEFGMKQQYLLAKRNRFLDDQSLPNQRLATELLKDLTVH